MRHIGLFTLPMVLVVGCGGTSPPPRPAVEGTVKVNGKPVTNASLTLLGDGEGANKVTQRLALRGDGSFAGSVPQPGVYKVKVEPAATEDGFQVPPKYRDPATSGLVWDIQPGPNKKDFDLK